jgi:hypothetical protein
LKMPWLCLPNGPVPIVSVIYAYSSLFWLRSEDQPVHLYHLDGGEPLLLSDLHQLVH